MMVTSMAAKNFRMTHAEGFGEVTEQLSFTMRPSQLHMNLSLRPRPEGVLSSRSDAAVAS